MLIRRALDGRHAAALARWLELNLRGQVYERTGWLLNFAGKQHHGVHPTAVRKAPEARVSPTHGQRYCIPHDAWVGPDRDLHLPERRGHTNDIARGDAKLGCGVWMNLDP